MLSESYNTNIILKFEKLIDLIKKTNKLESDKKVKIINNFRIRQLINALNMIIGLDYELDIEKARELNLPGIGKGTIARIIEILETGHLEEIDELQKKFNESSKEIDIITQLNDVVGIGDKRAIELIKKFKVKSIQDLINKINLGIINVNDKIKLGLKYYGKYKTNIPRSEIDLIYKLLDKTFYKLDKKLLCIICGSYRRQKPTSGDIDVLLMHSLIFNQEDVIISNYLTTAVQTLKDINFLIDDLTETDGGTKYMGFCKYKDNPVRRIDIRMVGVESFFPALIYFTGSYELNQKMRKKAKDLGYKLNEYGLYDIHGNSILITNEEKLFNILNLDFIEPQNR